MRSRRCSMGIISVEFSGQEKGCQIQSGPSRDRRVACGFVLSCWNTVLVVPCNKVMRPDVGLIERMFIREQYPTLFKGPRMMTTTSRLSIQPCFERSSVPMFIVRMHVNVLHAICCIWVWVSTVLFLEAIGFGYHLE
ncbi:hypothetical protein TNCV_3361341 [Trichonephila clavipes]|nr:hypothetical protein TNCV_3361341 [Trichonephila clavipes]